MPKTGEVGSQDRWSFTVRDSRDWRFEPALGSCLREEGRAQNGGYYTPVGQLRSNKWS